MRISDWSSDVCSSDLKTVHYLHANGDAVPSQPGPSASARPDVFMWAVIDWHFRTQRPQHLARGLMEVGHRVFYLSNNLVDDSQPGFNLAQLDDRSEERRVGQECVSKCRSRCSH